MKSTCKIQCLRAVVAAAAAVSGVVAVTLPRSSRAATIFYQDFNNGNANVVQAQNSAWLTTPMEFFGNAALSSFVPTVAGVPASAWGESLYLPQTQADLTNGVVSYVAPAATDGHGGIKTGDTIPSLVSGPIGTFTLEYWVYALSAGPNSQGIDVNVGRISDAYPIIWGKYIQPGGANEIFGGFQNTGSNSNANDITSAFPADTWYHVTFTYNSISGNLDLYVNAALAAQLAIGTALTNGITSSLMPVEGTDLTNSGPDTQAAFAGYLEDIRLSNTIITPNDPNSGWNGPIVVAPEPAVLGLLLCGGMILLLPRHRRGHR